MAELVSIKRNVDVSPGQAAPAVFHCSQGDVGSKIILGLLNNGTAYSIPSGVTVTIEGSESNGSIFTPISATASGSDITFYLTGEMTAVAGPAICQAVLKSGSNILGTANFTLEVESSPMGADAPPVFTDAGWTWMLNKLTTEFVPALGNETIIDAIDSKADQSDLTALSNTVAGHTGSITVLNSTVNTLNRDVTENRQNIARKLDKNQGTANAGKYLKVGTDGNIETADLDVTTDKTLSIADKAADAKAVGDELTDLKADLTQIGETVYERKEETGSIVSVNSAAAKCILRSDIPNLDVKHTGKNLLETPYAYAPETTTTINGISYTPHADGSITVTGTATTASNYQIVREATALRRPIEAGTYTLSGCPAGGGSPGFNMFLSAIGQGNLNDFGNGVTFTISEPKTYYIKFAVSAGISVDFTIYPQLELGAAKTQWEKYKGETLTLSNGEAESNTYDGINVFIATNDFDLSYFVPKASSSAVASIKDFGAKGDGVTDDTEAINTALTACEGKPLFIPEGEYIFSGTLNVKSGTPLYGCGEKSVLKLADSFSLTPYDWRPEDGGLSLYKWGMIVLPVDSSGIILDNFVVEGQTATFVDQAEVCVAVRGNNHIIRNVITRDINYFPDNFSGRQYNAPGEGIEVFKATSILVENCICERCGYEGIGTESAEDVMISNCKVGDTNQTGIQIHRSSKHIRVNNCTVDYSESVLAGTAFTFHANVGVDMEDIHVCDNYLCKGVTLIGGAENDVYFINNTIISGALTRNGNIYRKNWFIRGNKFLNGGIINRIDNCIITDNMLTVNTGYFMVNIYGNNVTIANNIALGSVSDTRSEPHDA